MSEPLRLWIERKGTQEFCVATAESDHVEIAVGDDTGVPAMGMNLSATNIEILRDWLTAWLEERD
jgi:hypothetical protein